MKNIVTPWMFNECLQFIYARMLRMLHCVLINWVVAFRECLPIFLLSLFFHIISLFCNSPCCHTNWNWCVATLLFNQKACNSATEFFRVFQSLSYIVRVWTRKNFSLRTFLFRKFQWILISEVLWLIWWIKLRWKKINFKGFLLNYFLKDSF